ncbi:MAG: shikimate dehydrogenase [Anaerolineales bacterium]|nr:shikimate dehydrogenase [Anaerolineales bacterium]
MSLSTSHFRLGLIGYPLGHSLSPKIHAAALRSCGLEGDYSLFPIHPDDMGSLKDLLSRLRSGEIQGLNVTIPHKQNVMQVLDELTATARSIGAVNTIYLWDHKLIGDNTDAPGFLRDLDRFLANSESPTANRKSSIANRKSVIVLGAGGSARAVVYALLMDGWQVTIAARRIEQARGLADSFSNDQLTVADLNLSNIELSNIALVVNTTPVGMTPNVAGSPWPANLPFPPHAAIYDLVYNPRETKLVRDACLQGLSATTGLGMLIEQAALSFEIWTAHKPAREVMFAAADQTAH